MSRLRQRSLTWLVLGFGFAFLYLPILILMVYSFNESRLATVWSGFSVKWYGELFRDQQMLQAAWISLKIAFWTATAAMVLGTLAALVMTRMRRFPGKTLFGALITAPLVMPEVITGLSMLLLFIKMWELTGWPERGLTTVIIAHVTFTLSYVAVVMRSRFLTLDLSLEEAAQDLGAKPLKVFFVITLPIVAPAIVSGWLLGFTISLDDLVITNFTNGPGTTTLPQIVFSKVRLGLDPKINALASIIIAIVSIGVIFATIHMRRQEAQRQRDEQMAIRAIAAHS